MFDTSTALWHPVASASDLPYRHVHHAQLLGREFAVWRADDGYVNVWENRCLHRGVRLSIGINDGRELMCQYHGWRYANRSAGCTYIPAHPADAPARTICNRTFPCVERYGLVWTAETPQGEPPALAGFDAALTLRPVPVNAPADAVLAALEGYGADADRDGFALTLTGGDGRWLAFFVQPVDSARSVIRGLLADPPEGAKRTGLLRQHSRALSYLRDRVEAQPFAEAPAMEPLIERVSPELAEMPEPGPSGRRAALRVTVARKWAAAEDVAGLELRPVSGALPAMQPGAHIDLHLPNGLIRPYSLVNGPGETDHLVVGVKREPQSRGGSAAVHDSLREGDVLAISEPRNNFPLRRDAVKTILIAGGIGVTPLLAMAQVLANQGLSYEMHFFARSPAHLPFTDRLDGLGEAVHRHIGLDPAATAEALRKIAEGPGPYQHVYLCGPGPMLSAAREILAESGWPEEAVHFEYFANDGVIDTSSSFEVALARSCVTLQVPAGKSILETLRETGLDMPSSCEQGACGTCQCSVIEGTPDHQDVYLTPAEKAAGDKIMTCVSRAKSARLVLDL